MLLHFIDLHLLIHVADIAIEAIPQIIHDHLPKMCAVFTCLHWISCFLCYTEAKQDLENQCLNLKERNLELERQLKEKVEKESGRSVLNKDEGKSEMHTDS